MRSNYDVLGNHIRTIDTRNTDLVSEQVLGINIDKFFMPSVANVIGTDLSRYKLISKGKFACNPMHVGRDERLPVALYTADNPAIVSPAYFMFEIKDERVLDPEYLMMWFRRPEFDRVCWLRTDGSVRGGITWEDLCRIELPVPSLDEQKEVVAGYKAITERIALKRKINDNLEDAARTLYKQSVVSKTDDDLESVYSILKVINGAAFSSEFFNSDRVGYPLIRIRDLSTCNPDVYTSETLSNMEYINCGDILIGMDGEFIPHIWFGDVGVLNQRVCKVVPIKDYIHPLFLYWTLKPILAEIQRTQGGTTVIHVGKKDFDRMKVYHLSKEEHLDFKHKAEPIFAQLLCNYQETLKMSLMQSLLLSKLSR